MQNRKIYIIGLIIALCVCFTGCKNKSVIVFAASSLEPVLTDILADFEASEGIKIQANYASSGQLITQLESGARANIFISAGAEQAQRAENLGIASDSLPIVKNTLVMIWKNGDYKQIIDVKKARLVALGETKTVPAGQYAKEALVNAELYSEISENAVYLANVREVMTAVKSGNADVGFVYKSDLWDDEDLKYIDVPPQLYSEIFYPLILLEIEENKSNAEKLIDYLFGEKAKAAFEEKGFIFVERNSLKK